ncbi:LuxR family transcriptional regulator [Nesterenkonia muleiensis]|uniref:LuxR family transcriptional regulator n=1 Tax=Nesterenkonia muleiensis TaxID=2282648 RepID=UPI000E7160D4|nr:LuxR family transcriptional regulator [Nesterenkonia muleiensis]
MSESPQKNRRDQAHHIAETAQAQNGMLLLVTGAAGMGKTYYLRAVGDKTSHAEPADAHRHYVYADAFEQNIPYSFVERLLSSGLADEPHVEPDTEPVEIARHLLRHLVEVPSGVLRTVLIDDAQWIDEESTRVLRYVIPRVVQQGVFVAFAARTPYHEDSFTGFLQSVTESSPIHRYRHLEALSTSDIKALAVERFETAISTRTAQSILEAARGTFLGVDKVFSGLTPGEVKTMHLTWDLQIRGAAVQNDPFLSGYTTMGPAGKLAAEVASFASHEIPKAVLRDVAEKLGHTPDIDEACAAGILLESGFGSSVLVSHALIAHAIQEAVPAERAKEIYRALAAASEDHATISYALRGAQQWDEDLGARVDDHVNTAVENGHYRYANDILRASIDLAPPAERQRLITDLALLNMRRKTGFAVIDLLPEIEAMPYSPVREFLAIVLGYYKFEDVAANQRVQTLLQDRSQDPETRTVQAFMCFMSVMMMLRSREMEALHTLMVAARPIWSNAPEDPGELTDPRLAWMVAPRDFEVLVDSFSIVPLYLNNQLEQVREQMPTLVERLRQRPPSSYKIDAIIPLAGAAVALDDIELANSLTAEATEMLGTVDPPWASGNVRVIYAHTLLLQGRLSEANRVLTENEELSFDVPDLETRFTSAALRAWLAAVTGDGNGQMHLEETKRLHEVEWVGYGFDLAVMAECEIALLAGKPEDILAATAPEQVEGLIDTRRGFLTHRVHALIDCERFDEAEELIGTLAQWRGIKWAETWGTLCWLQARMAHSRGHDAEADELYQRAVNETTYPLPKALTRSDYGTFLASRQRGAEAKTQFRKATETLNRIGAVAHISRVVDRSTALGDLDHLAHLELLSALTPREREVAHLLAEGSTNKHIADVLFVSQATARFHVSNVLRKLGITNRAQVARVLRGPVETHMPS